MQTRRLIDPETGQEMMLVPVYKKPEYVGREYIMSRLGITTSCLSKCPWHMPDFGEKVKERRRARPYLKRDVDEWLSIPAKERRERYMEYRRNNGTDK